MPRSKRDTLEKPHVEDPAVRWAKSHGVKLVYKMAAVYDRSWPDRMFLIPGGRPLFIEFKRPGAKPTAKQWQRINELREIGYDVEVCDSKEQGIACVRAALRAASVYEESD